MAAFPDIKEALVIWLRHARSQTLPITAAVLRAKATELAAALGHSEFQSCSGWLGQFKGCHNIVFKKICGESAAVYHIQYTM